MTEFMWHFLWGALAGGPMWYQLGRYRQQRAFYKELDIEHKRLEQQAREVFGHRGMH